MWVLSFPLILCFHVYIEHFTAVLYCCLCACLVCAFYCLYTHDTVMQGQCMYRLTAYVIVWHFYEGTKCPFSGLKQGTFACNLLTCVLQSLLWLANTLPMYSPFCPYSFLPPSFSFLTHSLSLPLFLSLTLTSPSPLSLPLPSSPPPLLPLLLPLPAHTINQGASPATPQQKAKSSTPPAVTPPIASTPTQQQKTVGAMVPPPPSSKCLRLL